MVATRMIGRNAVRNITLQQIAALILLLVCFATIGIFVFDEIRGISVDSEIQTLIAFLTGVVSTILGYRGGANGGSNTHIGPTDSISE